MSNRRSSARSPPALSNRGSSARTAQCCSARQCALGDVLGGSRCPSPELLGLGCPQVQKRGPSPPTERPETVLDAGSGPERRRHSCAQAESVIGTCVPPRANWSLTYPHRPHIPTRPPLRCPLHSAFARLRRAHSDRLKYPQVPSSRPIPVAGSRLLCAPGRPSRGLGHLQARLRAIPLRRRLESP